MAWLFMRHRNSATLGLGGDRLWSTNGVVPGVLTPAPDLQGKEGTVLLTEIYTSLKSVIAF